MQKQIYNIVLLLSVVFLYQEFNKKETLNVKIFEDANNKCKWGSDQTFLEFAIF